VPTFLSLTFAATVGLFAFTSALTAQPPATGTQPAKTEVKPDDLKGSQDENAKLYKRLADEMLRLAQRWEKSDNPDEKERAKTLRAALDLAAKHGVDTLFRPPPGAGGQADRQRPGRAHRQGPETPRRPPGDPRDP